MMRGSRLRQLHEAMQSGSVRLWKNDPARWLVGKGLLAEMDHREGYGVVTKTGRIAYFVAIGEHTTHKTLTNVMDHHLRASLSKENRAARKAARIARDEKKRLQGGWTPMQATQVSGWWASMPVSMHPASLDVDLCMVMFG